MRGFVMRFRGIMRSGDVDKLSDRINNIGRSGVYAMQRFGRSLLQDLGALRNAMTGLGATGKRKTRLIA